MAVRIVVASASPRRRALVGLLGLAWRAVAVDLEETRFLLADPFVGALNVAAAKARAASGSARTDEIVLAADTLVVADGAVLGKPTDAAEAAGMLAALRGKPHVVLTAVVLHADDGRQWGAVVSTQVQMRDYAATEVAAYVARGEPFDKAGGYAIQDTTFSPVERTRGCYLNVVGLPLCAAAAGLAALGIPLFDGPQAAPLPPCGYCRSGADVVGGNAVPSCW